MTAISKSLVMVGPSLSPTFFMQTDLMSFVIDDVLGSATIVASTALFDDPSLHFFGCPLAIGSVATALIIEGDVAT